METLFTQQEAQHAIARINALTPATQRQWGKMDVTQMLGHCAVGFRGALGDQQFKQVFIGKIFGRFGKKNLMSDAPFKRGLPTDKRFIITSHEGFTKEQEKLIALIERFSKGPSVITQGPHPFFGMLTPAEWDRLMYKHLDHHLRQFGV